MSKDIETIEGYIRMKLKRVYFNGSTDVIARQNGLIPNDTTLGEAQIEVELKDILTSIQKIIERAKPARKEMTASTEFTTWDRKTKIVKTWESESDPGFNRGIDEYERALTNALYGEKI